MATLKDVQRIALSLADTEASPNDHAFSVRNKDKLKGFAWVWQERLAPKKPRVPNTSVIAVRVPNLAHKDATLAAEPEKFFTEPHYNGYPAVLVRLGTVRVPELRSLLEDAWRCQAPKATGGRR